MRSSFSSASHRFSLTTIRAIGAAHGVAVFPVSVDGPLTPNGPKDATNDERVIRLTGGNTPTL
jgi:hypothetical protein